VERPSKQPISAAQLSQMPWRSPAPRQMRVRRAADEQQASLAPDTRVEDDGLAEDEAIRAADKTAEQRVWRAAWAEQKQDDKWTEQVREQVSEKAKSLPGKIQLQELSCRATICRMYLKFAGPDDAQAFISGPQDRAAEYRYQSLDPEFERSGDDRSNSTYEVLIKREQPEQLAALRDSDRSGTAQAAHGVPSTVGSSARTPYLVAADGVRVLPESSEQ
jgi:hypothetical protein